MIYVETIVGVCGKFEYVAGHVYESNNIDLQTFLLQRLCIMRNIRDARLDEGLEIEYFEVLRSVPFSNQT